MDNIEVERSKYEILYWLKVGRMFYFPIWHDVFDNTDIKFLDDFYNDENAFIEGSKIEGSGLKFGLLSDRLKGDVKFIANLIDNDLYINDLADGCMSFNINDNYDIMLKLIKRNYNAVYHIGDNLRDNKEFMMSLLDVIHINLFDHLFCLSSDKLKNDNDFKNKIYSFFSNEREKIQIIPFISAYYSNFASDNDEYDLQKDSVIERLKNGSYSVGDRLFSDQLRYCIIKKDWRRLFDDEEVMKIIISSACSKGLSGMRRFKGLEGAFLRYASDRLKKNKDFVLFAVSIECENIVYASDELKSDKDIVLAALNNSKYSDVLLYFDEKFRDDEEVMLLAISKDYIHSDFKFLLSDRLRDNEDFLLKCLNEKGVTIPVVCLSDKLRNDKVFASKYANGKLLKYFSSEVWNDKEIVLEIVKKEGIRLSGLPNNLLRRDYDIIKIAIEFDSDVYDELDWDIKIDPDILSIYEKSRKKKIKKILDESIHIDVENLSNYFDSIYFESLSEFRNLGIFWFGEKVLTNCNDDKFKVAVIADLIINFFDSEFLENCLNLIRIDSKVANSNICGVQLIVLAKYLNNKMVESFLLRNGALDFVINEDEISVIKNIVSMYSNGSIAKQSFGDIKMSDDLEGVDQIENRYKR